MLLCRECKKPYPFYTKLWRCQCEGILDLQFQGTFPKEKIKNREPSMWRYLEALPITDMETRVTFQEGYTPLVPIELPKGALLVKDDRMFPSGSYKDRGASLMVSWLKGAGIKEVVEDSSGNAGSALAAYCAKAKINCRIFAPQSASKGKVEQIKKYGAELRLIPGPREASEAAVLEQAKTRFYASHCWNPFFIHGVKTLAFEIWEQLEWRA